MPAMVSAGNYIVFKKLKYVIIPCFVVLFYCVGASARPVALVYRGPAGCDDCSSAIAKALESSRFQFEVKYVGPNEKLKLTSSSFVGASLYVQPGGGQDIPAAKRSLGKAGIQAVRDYVANGGRYLGICMGAYLATDFGFDIVEGETDSEVGRPNFPVSDIGNYVVPMKWKGLPVWVYYQDGPYLPKNTGNPGFREFAHYKNGDLAAARYSFGKGSATLVGPHPEATSDWYEEHGLHNPDGINAKLIHDVLDEAMAQ